MSEPSNTSNIIWVSVCILIVAFCMIVYSYVKNKNTEKFSEKNTFMINGRNENVCSDKMEDRITKAKKYLVYGGKFLCSDNNKNLVPKETTREDIEAFQNRFYGFQEEINMSSEELDPVDKLNEIFIQGNEMRGLSGMKISDIYDMLTGNKSYEVAGNVDNLYFPTLG